MKKIFAGMLAVVITFSAVAQGNKESKGKGEMGQRRGPENVRRQGMIGGVNGVNLTDAQKQQIQQLNDSYKQQMQELNKNESITVREQRERRETLSQQHRTNIQNVLTAEQKQELEAKKKEYKDKAKGHDKMKDHKKGKGGDMMDRGGDRAEKGGDHLRQLNLTESQNARIKTVNEEFRTKVQNIQKNTSLSQDQKKVQRDIAQTNHTEAIRSILTQEQKEKLEALRRTKPERKAKK